MGVNYIHFIIDIPFILVKIFHFESYFFGTLLLRNTSQHFCMQIILKYIDKFMFVYFLVWKL